MPTPLLFTTAHRTSMKLTTPENDMPLKPMCYYIRGRDLRDLESAMAAAGMSIGRSMSAGFAGALASGNLARDVRLAVLKSAHRGVLDDPR